MKLMLRRFAVLASSNVLTQLIAFAALAIAARRVGPANLGAYSVVLGIVTFLSLPISSGITAVGVRDIAQNRERLREVTGEVFLVQLILACGFYVVLVVLAPLIAPTDAMRRLFPVVALFLLTGTSFEWTLQALGQMRQIAVARIVGQVTFGALVPLLVVGGIEGIIRYAWLMIGGLALKHALTAFFVAWDVGGPRLRVTPRRLWRRFRASVPMGYASAMLQVYGQVDQVMLGYLSTSFDAGQYAAAYRIPGAILNFGASWISVVFPHSAGLARNKGHLRRHAGMLLSLVIMFALPLAVCTPLIAHQLIVAAFGAKYGPAATAFSLLTVMVGLTLIDATLTMLVLSLGGDRRYALIVTATALFNIVINLVVIPLFGRNGAAIDTIVSELLLFALLVRTAGGLLGGLSTEWGRIARAALATCPAALALLLLPADTASVWIRVALGAGVYGLATVLLGAVRISELRTLVARQVPST